MFRTAYGPKLKVPFETTGKTRTRQAMKDECDINVIMRKYERSGLLEHVNRFQGEYGDFAAIDFQDAMNTVVAATEMFESVPARIRAKFGNDPGAFLEFATDAKNMDEMRSLGLAKPLATQTLTAELKDDAEADAAAEAVKRSSSTSS